MSVIVLPAARSRLKSTMRQCDAYVTGVINVSYEVSVVPCGLCQRFSTRSCSNSRPRPRACWAWAPRRVPERRAGIGGRSAPCWTTRPASSRPARSGRRARSGRSGTYRTGGPVATGCSASRSRWPKRATCNSSGLKIVSCYQYGKGSTADWLGGAAAGLQHAQRGMAAARRGRRARPAPPSTPRSMTTRPMSSTKAR